MKPVIEYSSNVGSLEVGNRAAVYIVSEHPVLGVINAPRWVHTSQVQEVKENGDFETLNSIYKKV